MALMEQDWLKGSEHKLVGIRGHLRGDVTPLAPSCMSHLKSLGFNAAFDCPMCPL